MCYETRLLTGRGVSYPHICDPCAQMVRLRSAASLAVVCSLVLGASAYYLPGTYPREFAAGQHVQGALRPTCSCSIHHDVVLP